MNTLEHPLVRLEAWAFHWPEYLIEAAGLGLFMFSACTFGVFLDLKGSWGSGAIPDPVVRRFAFGLAIGLTAIGIIYSPWGKRSGAHINPAVTLTFLRLGKLRARDACWYIVAQFCGAIAGVALAALLYGPSLADPSVHYEVTRPGGSGAMVAFLAELVISFGLMLTVLAVSNSDHFAPLTGLCAGFLIVLYITVEAPLSGMSMNPARTIGSAVFAGDWTDVWIYLTAPILGMLLAAQTYVSVRGIESVLCAKLHHRHSLPCIFACGYQAIENVPSPQ